MTKLNAMKIIIDGQVRYGSVESISPPIVEQTYGGLIVGGPDADTNKKYLPLSTPYLVINLEPLE